MCSPGDIVAGIGLKNTTTGDTLSAQTQPIQLESMEFPAPVIPVAIEPKTKSDDEKLSESLHRLSGGGPDLPGQDRRGDRPDHHLRDGRAPSRDPRRPPSPRVQGGCHGGQAPGRLPGDHPARAGGEGRVLRHVTTGGKGQYAHVVINLEPTGPGGGYEFVDQIKGGRIPP